MKRQILSSLATIALASLGGCVKNDASRYTPDGLFKIRLQSTSGFSEYIIADSLGLWKKEGLQAVYIGVLTAGTEIPAALSGKVDVIGGHPNGIIKARLAGAKITAVIPSMVDDSANPHLVYHVRKESGITGIEGFRELARRRKIKIAVVGRNGCADWYFDEWLQAGGVAEDALDWQIMPAQQQLNALSQGLVDVVTTHAPFINAADADPRFHRVLSSYDILHNPAAGASVRGFTDKFIKQYPDAVAAFTRAITRAHQWSNAHPDSSKLLFSRVNKLPVEKVSIIKFNDRPWINDSDINPWILRQIAHKDIRPDAKVEASDIYTNEFNPYWKDAGKPNSTFPLESKHAEDLPQPTSTGLVQRFFERIQGRAAPQVAKR